MDGTTTSSRPGGTPIQALLDIVTTVIKDPVQFFRTMPRTGGFADPLIFVVAMSVASSLVAVPFWLLGVGPFAAFPGILFSFVVAPLMTALFSFVGAGVLFVLWRTLGSRESYEASYRCAAYMSALSPLAVPLSLLPYFGELIMVAWGFFLVVAASEQVHGIARQKARLVFGALAVVFALLAIGSQRAARSVQVRAGAVRDQLDKFEEMTPEEAGKAVGDLLKSLQGPENDDKNADE